MKVLMIGSFDLFLHPYSKHYLKMLDSTNVEYRFIFWNRSGEKIEKNSHIDFFDYPMNTYQSLFNKIGGYILFRRYVLEYIDNFKPDKLIVLTTQTLFLIRKLLNKKYRNKYLFDYRDETYEKYFFYKNIVAKLIANSYFTVVSSLGFSELFPKIDKKKFILCHNVKDSFFYNNIKKTKSDVIRLSFWGMIRQTDYYKRVFSLFGNDNRFVVNMYGEGYVDELKSYVLNNHFQNIFFFGKFQEDNLPLIAANTDILLNCYSNKSTQKNAITIKMYEGISYGIPMIVQKNSFMDNYLDYYNCPHYSFDFDGDFLKFKEPFLNKIIEFEKLVFDSKTFCKTILRDQLSFKDSFLNFLEYGNDQ